MEDRIKLLGSVHETLSGKKHSNLIIPVGDYNILISTTYEKHGSIENTILIVYHKDKDTIDSENDNIFGIEFVVADSETIFEAMNWCQRKIRKGMK